MYLCLAGLSYCSDGHYNINEVAQKTEYQCSPLHCDSTLGHVEHKDVHTCILGPLLLTYCVGCPSRNSRLRGG